MTPFPTSFPADAAQLVIDHQAGVNNVAPDQAELACWNLCGYVKGQVQAQGPPAPATSGQAAGTPQAAAAACSDAEMTQHLKTLTAGTGGGKKAAPNIPWEALFAALVALFQKLAEPSPTPAGGAQPGQRSAQTGQQPGQRKQP
jgi:hypothetical protein